MFAHFLASRDPFVQNSSGARLGEGDKGGSVGNNLGPASWDRMRRHEFCMTGGNVTVGNVVFLVTKIPSLIFTQP